MLRLTRKHVINYWNFLLIAVSVVYPSIPAVLTYLRAHLKAVSIGSTKLESKIAAQCLKSLSRNLIQPIKRKFPPSIVEIKAILLMRESVTRFYSADGQSRALPFNSSTSVADIYDMLSERLNLKNKDEFALYELFDNIGK